MLKSQHAPESSFLPSSKRPHYCLPAGYMPSPTMTPAGTKTKQAWHLPSWGPRSGGGTWVPAARSLPNTPRASPPPWGDGCDGGGGGAPGAGGRAGVPSPRRSPGAETCRRREWGHGRKGVLGRGNSAELDGGKGAGVLGAGGC